jgi:DNA polymerase-3 subunit gamma/tau
LNGPVRELARNVHLRSTQGNQWEFAIAHSLMHLGSENCISRLNLAISEHLGHPIVLRLVESDGADLPTLARLEALQLRTRLSDAERAIQDDPVVQALKEQLGARIIDESIQPLQ